MPKYHESKKGHLHQGGEFANMPEGVIMRKYDSLHDYMEDHLDDTESGIKSQVEEDARVRNKIKNPRKA